MKKLFYLLLFTALIVSSGACRRGESVNEWRDANTAAYQAITQNSNYKELKTETGPSGVYYKVIKSGTGTEYPLQTSYVKIYYKGAYYDGSVFDEGTSGNDIPKIYSTQETVRGFSFALQNMVVGDKWEIWIPYYLGYGVSGLYDESSYQTIIRGYTTLVFEVELVDIIQYLY